MRRPHMASIVVSSLITGVLLVGCGESAEEKAKAEVCSARTAISQQVTKLQGLTVSSTSTEEVKSSIEAIGDELKKIKDAQADLNPARKQQVETATTAFGSELRTTAASVVSALAAGTASESALLAAKPKLEASLNKLANSSKQALAPIECS